MKARKNVISGENANEMQIVFSGRVKSTNRKEVNEKSFEEYWKREEILQMQNS